MASKSNVWWKATGYRVARTFLVVLSSWVAVDGGFSNIDWVPALSAAALAALLSFLTALVDLPEVDSASRPKWLALVLRAVKSFAQAFIAVIPAAAVFLDDVNWDQALNVALGAAIGSVVLGLISVLPESNPHSTAVVQTQDWKGTAG